MTRLETRKSGGMAWPPVLRLAVVCFVASFCFGSAVARSQITIDTFATAQAQLLLQDPADSPGDTTSSNQGGAGMIDGQRDLFLTWLVGGTGPASTAVTGGLLLFNSAADSDARVLVTWDGDTDPNNLSATGLGNEDFTSGGTQSALRLT